MSQASQAETPRDRPAVSFGRYYYQHDCGIPYERNEHWLAEFRTIARALVRRFQPATALDAGCAIGLLVETLREAGVQAAGIDTSEYAISQAHESVRAHLRQSSLADPIEGRYDLVTCIEVVEHMDPADAQNAPGADSEQSLKTLLNGTGAEAAVRPQLEIYTDRVRAVHGATTGKLDEQMLFYMLSRGLDRREAQALLQWAFIEDAVSRVDCGGLREEIERLVAAQLHDVSNLDGLLNRP